MKILQLCHKMPYPLYDGGAWSLFHTALGLLDQGADVKILAIQTPKNWIDANCIPADFREKTGFEHATVDTRFNPFKAFINLFTEQSYFVERFFSEEYKNSLIQILKNESFDILQLEHINMCLYLETIRTFSDAKIILRAQNVENKVWKRYLENQANPLRAFYIRIAANRLEQFERNMADKVDGIIAISSADTAVFRSYAPATPSISVPMGFDFSKISCYDINKQFDHFPVYYHLGAMDWLPNVQGVKWFIKEVIPHIIETNSGFVFRIAGKKMPGWFYKRQNHHLIVDRDIKESLSYHEDKAVMIVPLLSGGGIRAKIIEGMALGKTIISTTIGAEGIPCTNQENILIADTKEDFARQINKCGKSKEFCQKTGRNAQRLAIENYDYNITAKSMMEFYQILLSGTI